MYKKVSIIFGLCLILVACKSSGDKLTSIVLDEKGVNVNGVTVTQSELEAKINEIGESNDSVTIQLIYGYSHDEMFELKRLLNEANVKKIREIK